MLTVDRALFLARACSLAFVPPRAIPSNSYATGLDGSQLQVVTQIEDPATQTGATVFRSGDETIIACRGSASVRNFFTNFNLGPAPLIQPDGKQHPTAKVHAGFQIASAELWKKLEPSVRDCKSLHITGHSLGGGTATLIGLAARAAGVGSVELTTFAGPRLGNGAFCEYYREQCGTATHLVHADDGVLKSNNALWNRVGFEHIGNVVRCDKKAPCLYDGEDGALCIADPNFSEKDLRFKDVFVDHCLYMGVYIGLRAQHPSVWLRAP